jgi:hypothetical protein
MLTRNFVSAKMYSLFLSPSLLFMKSSCVQVISAVMQNEEVVFFKKLVQGTIQPTLAKNLLESLHQVFRTPVARDGGSEEQTGSRAAAKHIG